MAAAKKGGSANVKVFKSNPKKNRKGIHKKSKSSKHKGSKNYKKAYRGQGR